jgi:hypothetical protein
MEELPGDVQRKIDSGEINEDPMWYFGRSGPSVEEVLDAEGSELAELEDRAREIEASTQQDSPPSRRRRNQ